MSGRVFKESQLTLLDFRLSEKHGEIVGHRSKTMERTPSASKEQRCWKKGQSEYGVKWCGTHRLAFVMQLLTHQICLSCCLFFRGCSRLYALLSWGFLRRIEVFVFPLKSWWQVCFFIHIVVRRGLSWFNMYWYDVRLKVNIARLIELAQSCTESS